MRDIRLTPSFRTLFVVAAIAALTLTSACGGSSGESADPQPTVVSPSPTPISVEATSTPTSVVSPSPTAVKPTVEPTAPSVAEQPGLNDPVDQDSLTPSPTGRETAGTMIVIGDSEVRLPHDVWVKNWAADPPCDEGKRCPTAPYWTLQNEDALIFIDGNGKVWDEIVGCGNPTPFEAVKDALR